MPLPTVRHIFVYGTLRQGEERDINRLLPAPRWVGHARVPGVLYHLGAYPGGVLGAPGWIKGEVYEISTELERQLDEIEEVWPQQSGEYCKREIRVRLDGAACLGRDQQGCSTGEKPEEVVCIVYEIAPERIFGMPVILCGDWVQHRAAESSLS
jgi:gamma-glutamylcyclotransferase (GGCT)/AIG2-like uncharacterized protein YtfP